MTTATVEAPAAVCAYCKEPRDVKATGRPGRYCSVNCRKADHRLRTAAIAARQQLPGLRRALDEALGDVEKAARRVHASGLSEDELLMRPEPYGETSRKLGWAVDRLRYAAQAHSEALDTAARHPAGAASDEDED